MEFEYWKIKLVGFEGRALPYREKNFVNFLDAKKYVDYCFDDFQHTRNYMNEIRITKIHSNAGCYEIQIILDRYNRLEYLSISATRRTVIADDKYNTDKY